MLEQLSGVTGVLGRNQYGLAQDAYGARRHIFKIADRGRDQVEGAHGGILSLPPTFGHLPYFPLRKWGRPGGGML